MLVWSLTQWNAVGYMDGLKKINFKSKYNIKHHFWIKKQAILNCKKFSLFNKFPGRSNQQLTSSDILNQGCCIFGDDSRGVGLEVKLTVMGQFLYFFENHGLKWSQSKYDMAKEK